MGGGIIKTKDGFIFANAEKIADRHKAEKALAWVREERKKHPEKSAHFNRMESRLVEELGL